jgi:N-acetylglutamate synthase-like GNAT family acetyltransferase
MVFRGDAAAIRTNPEVEVRIAGADDVLAVRDIVAPASSPAWLRRMVRQAILASLSEPWHTYYLACLNGQPVATLHLLCEGGTGGIYGVATLRAHRCQRAQATLMARALRDAASAGCDVVALRTAAGGEARGVFERWGFEPAHEQALWTAP